MVPHSCGQATQHVGPTLIEVPTHHCLACSGLPATSMLVLLLLSVQGTVGAGLPIIGTLKHLLETGDKAQLVEGIFSGTLSYIFNTFGDGRPFSEIVAAAKAQVCRTGRRRLGYTGLYPVSIASMYGVAVFCAC